MNCTGRELPGDNRRLAIIRLLRKTSWLTLEAAFAAQSNLRSPGHRRRWAIVTAVLVVRWSGAPVNAFSLWKPEAVRITSGFEHVAIFQKTERSQRKYCARCGGHLMTNHPQLGLVDVFAATIPTLTFTPGVHVNYAETVLPMRDGLPKLKDFPAEFGGSGEAIAE
jgi:hypothetical protein